MPTFHVGFTYRGKKKNLPYYLIDYGQQPKWVCSSCAWRGSWAQERDCPDCGEPTRRISARRVVSRPMPDDIVKAINESRDKKTRDNKARKEAKRLEVELSQEKAKAPTATTLAASLERWFKQPQPVSKLAQNTLDIYRASVSAYVNRPIGNMDRALGDYALSDITIELLEDWRDQLLAHGNRHGGRLSPKTVQNVWRLVSKALAREKRTIGSNPAAEGAGLTVPRLDHVTWTPEQVTNFLTYVKEQANDWYALCRLMVMTGVRRSEGLGLKWSLVDLEQGAITIKYVRVNAKGGAIEKPWTKNGRVRHLRIDDETVAVLRAHKARQEEHRRALEGTGAWHETDLVFTNEDGSPLKLDTVSRTISRLQQAAGVPRLMSGQSHRPMHGIRHTRGSLAIKNGEHPAVTQQTLGHAQISTTLNIYTHTDTEDSRAAAVAYAKLLEGSRK